MTSRGSLLGIVCACMVAVSPLQASMTPPPRAGMVEAVWKTQTATFNFRSVGRRYTCRVLQAKLRTILLRLGANENLELSYERCYQSLGVATLQISMQSPVEATPENVQQLTTYDAQDVLLARLRGIELPTASNMPRFTAEWQTISFRRAHKLHLDAGDCELVQQVGRQLVPKLSVMILKNVDTDCMQEMTGIHRPRLTVAALVAISEPK